MTKRSDKKKTVRLNCNGDVVIYAESQLTSFGGNENSSLCPMAQRGLDENMDGHKITDEPLRAATE